MVVLVPSSLAPEPGVIPLNVNNTALAEQQTPPNFFINTEQTEVIIRDFQGLCVFLVGPEIVSPGMPDHPPPPPGSSSAITHHRRSAHQNTLLSQTNLFSFFCIFSLLFLNVNKYILADCTEFNYTDNCSCQLFKPVSKILTFVGILLIICKTIYVELSTS